MAEGGQKRTKKRHISHHWTRAEQSLIFDKRISEILALVRIRPRPSAGIAAGLLLAAGLGIAAPAQALQYMLTDLGIASGFGTSLGLGVNDLGQVTGVNLPGSGTSASRGFVWSAGTGQQLLNPMPGGNDSYGAAINNNGIAVGSSNWYQAALWNPGNPSPIILPGLGGNNSYAFDINNGNAVAGFAHAPDNAYRAALWSPTGSGYAVTDLGRLPGLNNAYGLGINASRAVVGYGFTNAATDARAFVWTEASGMQALPLLSGGSVNEAASINDAGQAVGFSDSQNGQRAALWTTAPNAMQVFDLGLLPGDTRSRAWAVNNAGAVVGRSTGSGDRGFVWTDATTGMVDLNTVLVNAAGWVVNTAFDINNQGWITGWGTINGEIRAVLLTPVPAPGGGLLFAAGLLLLGAARRRRV